MEDKIIESIAYILPAIVTGIVAYIILNTFVKKEDAVMQYNALIQRRKESLPIKLQAYERLLLFSERINPINLLIRVQPIGDDTVNYLNLLIANIEQEYDHNMVQQLYVSEDSWKAILATKLTVIAKLRKTVEISETAKDLRENILVYYSQNENPMNASISLLKLEVKNLI